MSALFVSERAKCVLTSGHGSLCSVVAGGAATIAELQSADSCVATDRLGRAHCCHL